MIFSGRDTPRPAPNATTPRIPEDRRLYVIGDVHGRFDLLEPLLERIEEDIANAPCDASNIVFLGDYIDRGPASSAVVERIASGRTPAPAIALRGNHEAMLLQFLEDESVLEDWRRYGALEMLASYGVDLGDVLRGRGFAEARYRFMQKLPASHLAFFLETRLFWTLGDYFFCHAGCRPHVPLHAQQESDLLWIRETFLRFSGAWEKVIVHGHTPTIEPEDLPQRINLDTGAYLTGRLTCLILQGAHRRWLRS